ncbi:MAG: hypothetical protein ABIK31_06015 [candidate division WOR-3 bacterium]
MFRLNSKIIIGRTEFPFVCEVSTNESIETLTDTCTIQLPRKIKWEHSEIFFGQNPIIKKGDKVDVYPGYNDDLKLVFLGYVARIRRKLPVEIECEDEMWQLKQPHNIVKKQVFNKITLAELLQQTMPQNIEFKCPEMQLGRITIEADTQPIKVLELLTKQDTWGLCAYFQNINNKPILFVGLPNIHFIEYRKTQKFQFEYNIISDNLQYYNADDKKIKVKGISINSDNKKIEYEHGSADGELRTFHFTNLSPEQLKEIVIMKHKNFQVGGYEGSFTTFGEPYTRKADAVEITDYRFTATKETYSVKSVRRTFGTNGYRQEITLNQKIS